MSFITTPKASKTPTPIIVSTDFAGDADDVFDLRALATAHHRGMITLLGVVVDAEDSTPGADNVSAIDALLTYDGLPNIPMGRASAPNLQSYPSPYSIPIVTASPVFTRTKTNVPTAAATLRTLLAARPGRDVTLVGLGFFGAWHDLMLSGPDSISPLTGIQLIQQKVKRAVIMAGRYPTDLTFVEYNFGQGTNNSTRYFIDNWPNEIPVTWVGYDVSTNNTGSTVLGSASAITDPMQAALTASGYANGKIAWPATVLIAIAGDAAAAGYATVRGTVTYNVGMNSIFTEGPSNHEYATYPRAFAKLSSAASSGATTLTLSRPLTAGPYRLGTKTTGENITIRATYGAGPWTADLTTAITGSYALAAPVHGNDATAVNATKEAYEELLLPRAPLVVDESLWSPANARLSPELWLRAEDLSSLGVSGSVASWTDGSGNGHHFTQGALASRPTLQQDSKNRWVVRFDGINDRLDCLDAAIRTGDSTIWIVASYASDGTGTQCMMGALSSTTAHSSPFFKWSIINAVNFSRMGATANNPDGVANPDGTIGLPAAQRYAVNVWEGHPGYDGTPAGDWNVLRINGMPVGQQPPGNHHGDGNAVVVRIGSLGDGTWSFKGDIYEVLIFRNLQSPADRRRMRAYLRKKYHTA